MITFLLVVIYVIVCLLLIFFILIQSGKGGGLSSLGASSQGISDAFGSTGAERSLNKMTTFAAVAYVTLAILITLAVHHGVRTRADIIQDREQPTQPIGILQDDPAGMPPMAPPPDLEP